MKGLFREVWVPLREAGRVKSHYHFRPERAMEGNDIRDPWELEPWKRGF